MKIEYIVYKVRPHNSIRNYNSAKVAKAVSTMYRGFFNSIYREGWKLKYKELPKITYMIHFTKNEIAFYFVLPTEYESLFKEKITSTWQGVTMELSKLPKFENPNVYELKYVKEDALSLETDSRSNSLLNKLVNVTSIMEQGDQAAVVYNFIPEDQFSWKAEYDSTIDKIKKGIPIDKEKFNIIYIAKMVALFLCEIIDIMTETLTGNADLKKAIETRFDMQLLPATLKKRNDTIVGVQIVALSESKDKIRRRNNAYAVCESFQAITLDNKLSYNVVHCTLRIKDLRLPVTTNKMSVNECQNFLALPGREILADYKIDHVNTLESQLPEELQSGVMCIGENTYRGNKQKGYLSNDKEYRYLALTVIGPTRAGKTTLLANLSNDGLIHNETTIVFDFCGNCQLSDDIVSVVPKSRVLSIDCSKSNTLQGLGYNEVSPADKSIFEVYRCAKTKTSQLMTLVNSIAGEELRDRMERYLEAAAVVVFIQDGPIKDVFGILQDYRLRGKYISSCPGDQIENLQEYIVALEELNEVSKGTKEVPSEVIGTKTSFVQGILNRVQRLKQNTYMELMLKKDCSNNINLIEEMQKSQLICIRMPEIMFSTEQEKDIYCTYWLTKIWGALQKRKWDIGEKAVKVNIIIDELYQVPSCQDFLRSKLSQIAKFYAKPIISCHYLGQISKIRNELKAANSSYMLLNGCNKDNYNELKEELDPYVIEDLLNLKRYHSLNLIRCGDGWSKFITKLPAPIK